MKIFFFIISLIPFISLSAHAYEWGDIKKGSGYYKAVIIKDSSSTIKSSWFNQVVPGDLLSIVSISYDESLGGDTYTNAYKFIGIENNSLRIDFVGQHKGPSDSRARTDDSLGGIIYLEKMDDGFYYFRPDSIKETGVIKISRNKKRMGFYTAELIKSE